MLLVADIGNTNITLGVFNKEILVETFRMVSNKEYSSIDFELFLKNNLSKYKIEGCMIGSVVDEITKDFKQACDNLFNIKSSLVSNKLKSEIAKISGNTDNIGDDRIANTYAAIKTYKLPAIIVDIGTATTLDIISRDKKFIGGTIIPGLKMQLKALNSNTSKLPEIDIENSIKAIGDDTKSSILSGVVRGSACAISGLIQQCEAELGEKATIIATGGYSEFISKYLIKEFDYIEKNLTLFGLKYIYENSLVETTCL